MKIYEGFDALSALSDVLFEESAGPVPSFKREVVRLAATQKKENPSADIVVPRSSWEPAP